MSFREKSAWITLGGTLLIYGGYFLLIGRAWGGGSVPEFLAPLAGSVVLMAMLQIALHAIAAIPAPEEAGTPPDERERLIALRATRVGFYTLQAGAWGVIASLWWRCEPAVTANIVLFTIVAAELVRAGWQVVDFRRRAA